MPKGVEHHSSVHSVTSCGVLSTPVTPTVVEQSRPLDRESREACPPPREPFRRPFNACCLSSLRDHGASYVRATGGRPRDFLSRVARTPRRRVPDEGVRTPWF